jgi:hypothetical protein
MTKTNRTISWLKNVSNVNICTRPVAMLRVRCNECAEMPIEVLAGGSNACRPYNPVERPFVCDCTVQTSIHLETEARHCVAKFGSTARSMRSFSCALLMRYEFPFSPQLLIFLPNNSLQFILRNHQNTGDWNDTCQPIWSQDFRSKCMHVVEMSAIPHVTPDFCHY